MSDAAPDPVFTTREGVVDGQRAVFTVNQALGTKGKEWRGWLPWHVTVTILLDGGLPGGDEEESLGRLEDDLRSLLGATGEVDYVGRVTTDGLRELHFYLFEQGEAHEALTAFIGRGTPRELEHRLSFDPDWSEVEHLFANARAHPP